MAEGDSIHRLARRLVRALGGQRVAAAEAPNPRGPLRLHPSQVARLEGLSLSRAEARGKHLLLHFEDGVVVRSHLGVRGAWRVYAASQHHDDGLRGAWLVLSTSGAVAAQLGGSHLAVLTERELHREPRLRALGPDILGTGFEDGIGLAALRAADGSRQLGEALLDQRVISGIGNVCKSEGCHAAGLSPWAPLSDLTDRELLRVLGATRTLMEDSLERGRRRRRIYGRAGQPCPRCRTTIRARGQGDANRTTYWCPGCQPEPGAR
jgi:endonuclease VIII